MRQMRARPARSRSSPSGAASRCAHARHGTSARPALREIPPAGAGRIECALAALTLHTSARARGRWRAGARAAVALERRCVGMMLEVW